MMLTELGQRRKKETKMKKNLGPVLKTRNLAAIFIFITSFPSAFASKIPVNEIRYKAKTNMSAISIAGKAKSTPTAEVEVEGEKLTKFEVELSPNDLDSGLSLRDAHMREKIFQNADGSLPPIRFKLKGPVALKSEVAPVAAILQIRGKEVAFTPNCSGGMMGAKLKFNCSGSVNLANYDIPTPSHLGVKVNPEVEVAVATEQELRP